jgi:LmbE family N-acetylglucosaminyl deacetylase
VKVIVIATHPDDEVLGCGGVMARHAAQGDTVRVLVVTRGIPDLFPVGMIEETRKELRRAHDVLGVAGVDFLDFPAPMLDTIPGYQVADGISTVIRSHKPEYVYLPHRGDMHADHRAVFTASLVACRPGCQGAPRKLLCYETLSETDWAPPFGDDAFIPTVFFDISNYLEIKLKAMACYRSQLKNPPHTRSLQSLEALARLRGGTVGLHAAEAFMLMREVH